MLALEPHGWSGKVTESHRAAAFRAFKHTDVTVQKEHNIYMNAVIAEKKCKS